MTSKQYDGMHHSLQQLGRHSHNQRRLLQPFNMHGMHEVRFFISFVLSGFFPSVWDPTRAAVGTELCYFGFSSCLLTRALDVHRNCA